MTQSNPPTSGTNAAGAGVILSAAIKAVLIALVAVHLLPWDGQQTAAVALAISSVLDVAMYFGWIRPSLAAQLTAAAASVPPGAVAMQPIAVAVQVPQPPEEPTSPAGYDPRHDDDPTGRLPTQPFPHQDMT